MTIKIKLSCDARQCHNNIELYDIPTDKDLNGAGWHSNPYDPSEHICDKCWPGIKKELEEREHDNQTT